VFHMCILVSQTPLPRSQAPAPNADSAAMADDDDDDDDADSVIATNVDGAQQARGALKTWG